MAEVDLDAGGLKQTFKDLFAGAAGGIAQVLLGSWSCYHYLHLGHLQFVKSCYLFFCSSLHDHLFLFISSAHSISIKKKKIFASSCLLLCLVFVKYSP